MPPSALRFMSVGLALIMASVGGALAGAPDPILVRCTVFHDLDGNGILDAGEPGLPAQRVTNGIEVLLTDALGEVDVWVDRASYRFATLTVPGGWRATNSWFRWVPVGLTGPVDAQFGLEPDAATAADPVRWVHVTDTQVSSWGDPWRFDDDLREINALADPPLFLINTGDIVNVASDSTQWNNYLGQITASDHEILHVVGNHDTLATGGPPLEEYERHLGPPYYSRDAGSWHFVIYNSEVPQIGTPDQDSWVAADLAARPSGSFPMLFQHRMLAELNLARVNSWASAGIVANFSGHWHALRFAQHSSGMLDFNLSRTRSGPLDRTPRVFGIVTCRPDGSIGYELRRLAVDHRVEIVQPAPESSVPTGASFEVMVQAYDTSARVSALVAASSGQDWTSAPVSLTREGISLWRGALSLTGVPPGTHRLSVVGSFEDGTPIATTIQFSLTDVVEVVRAPVGDWPMFRRCAAGSSFTSQPLEPPLELAWSVPVPGMVALSSPVVADGTVYLGTRAETRVGEEGIVACDAATGNLEWFAPVPGGVALAPAVVEGIVVANSLADSIYALDAATGSRLWSVETPSQRYNLMAPIFEGDVVWAGGEPRPCQIRASTGQVDWRSEYLGNAWFPYMYTAPTVGPQRAYFSFYGNGADWSGGFSIVDRVTGLTQWAEYAAYRSPLRTPDALYVIGDVDYNNQALTRRDVAGTILWTAPHRLGAGTGSPALGHGTLVVPGAAGAVEAFRASDGQHLWSHAVGSEIYEMEQGLRRTKGTPGTAAIADSVVWIGSLDGNLYALDLGTGTELWSRSFGTPVASSPAVSGNMLFVGASDGHLYGFTSRESPPVATPEPAPGRASVLALYPPRPSPARGPLRLAWVQPDAGMVSLRVFDVAGRIVRTVVRGEHPAGEHEVLWDATDGAGNRAAAGIYFARLEYGERTLARKLVLLR